MALREAYMLKAMFQTWPVKISRIEPNSSPAWREGNSATIASITGGRKLRTGIDCSTSSSGIKIRSAAAERAAA